MSHRLLEINYWARSKRNFNLLFTCSRNQRIQAFLFCFSFILHKHTLFLFLHLPKALAQKQKSKSALKSSLLRQLQNRQFLFWHYPCIYLSRKLNLLVNFHNSCSPGTASESFCLEEWYHATSLKNPYTSQ